MRCKLNAQILIFSDTYGEWLAELTSIDKKSPTITPLYQTRKPEPLNNIHLCFSIPKTAALATIIRQTTELNVGHISPFVSEFTTNRNININRLKSIAIEASEQSGRVNVPILNNHVKLDKLLSLMDFVNIPPKIILCAEDHSGRNFSELDIKPTDRTYIFIGPEGGFSKKEFDIFNQIPNIQKLDLGSTILKCDTAATAAISLVINTMNSYY